MNQATSPTDGVIGQGVIFDGTNDSVSAPINLSGTNKATLSFWMKWNSFANDDKFGIEYTNNFNNKNGFAVAPNSSNHSKFGVYASGTGSIYNGGEFARPSAGVWHHYVVTFDRTTGTAMGVTAYVDGVGQSITQYNSSNLNSSNFDNASLYLMSRGNSSLFGSGNLDDVRIYNRAISASEIKRLYNIGAPSKIGKTQSAGSLSSGLVGHWTFDGKDTNWTSATAGTVTDKSGQGNTGTLTSMNQATSPTDGVIGQGMNFDGSDDKVSTNQTVSGLSAFSVSTWVKLNAYPPVQNSHAIVLNWNNAAVHSFSMYVNGGGQPLGRVVFSIRNYLNSDAGALYASALNDTNWHHIVGVYDGTNAVIYRDGVAGTPQAHPGPMQTTSLKTYIGGTSNGSMSSFPGVIDDVRTYNRAISASEIKRLYTMGRPTIMADKDLYWSNVKLLLHMDGTNGSTTFTDNSSSSHTVTVAGNAQLSTTLNRFGTASGIFTGAFGSLYLDGSSDFAFGTGDFTTEFWIYLNGGTGVVQSLYDSRDSFGAIAPRIYKSATEKLMYFTAGADKITGTTSMTQGVWHHVALSRYNGSTKLFLNGVQEGSTYTDTNNYVNGATSRPWLSADGAFGGSYIYGNLDELRVTKGVARYKNNFAVPVKAFPNRGY